MSAIPLPGSMPVTFCFFPCLSNHNFSNLMMLERITLFIQLSSISIITTIWVKCLTSPLRIESYRRLLIACVKHGAQWYAYISIILCKVCHLFGCIILLALELEEDLNPTLSFLFLSRELLRKHALKVWSPPNTK